MAPDFISQNGEKLSMDERMAWFKRQADDAKAEGAKLHRYSVHPTEPHLIILYEGWKDPRAPQDGEPAWQFTPAAQH